MSLWEASDAWLEACAPVDDASHAGLERAPLAKAIAELKREEGLTEWNEDGTWMRTEREPKPHTMFRYGDVAVILQSRGNRKVIHRFATSARERAKGDEMMTIVAILVFGGALALASFAIAATVGPRLAQITDILFARSPSRFEPLAALVRAERHIAVRRWAATPSARSAMRPREAA